uniref:Uncharacterized protein n=1 Tax=Colobus angolensis palliatus TaxID=336983 RepID=A0A2K5HKH1_COLAP
VCQYVTYSLSLADFNTVQKDPQWSYRVYRGKIHVYETLGNLNQCMLHKQAKQNTSGVSGK